jgi:hypothetical protein
VDFAAVAFVGWIAASGMVMMRYGAPRPTINAIWTWVSLIVAFLMLRQLLRGEREVRALCAVMIGLAVCLSVIAMRQTFVEYPAMREIYRRDADEALRQAGISAPPGTIQRKQFEDRINSTEPSATFSLTNSLAGFVAPWFVVLVGIAGLDLFVGDKKRHLTALALMPLAILPLAACLLLTKSRSAWLATIVGLVAIALARLLLAGGQRPAGSQRLASFGIIAAIAAVVIGSLVALLSIAGILDREILSQAGRSLAFRLEYWQATIAMIADHPLLGVGDGNFQEYYTAYKLPQASETIADPHNFLFEIAAAAGVPALLIFLVLMGLSIRGVFGRRTNAPLEKVEKPCSQVEFSVRSIYGGGLASIPLAAMIGLVMGFLPDLLPLLLGGAAGALAVWLLHDWVKHGELPPWLIVVAIGVLLVNLLVAGGISFPGVAITLWILLAGGQRPASSLTIDSECKERKDRVGRWPPAMGALVAATLLMACYVTAYQPVLARMRLLGAADEAQENGRFGDAIDFAHDAAAADRWSAEPRLQLAQLYFERWIGGSKPRGGGDDFQAFEAQATAAIERNQRAYPLASAIGYFYWEAFRQTNESRLRDEALRLAARAVGLYPHDALGRAQLAWILSEVGRPDEARREAAEALRLDALCPHRERKLALRRLFAESANAAQLARMPHELQTLTAEQWMQRLRKRNR